MNVLLLLRSRLGKWSRRSWRCPLCASVIFAPQRVAGVLRRRGGLVDVVRRPSRNDNSSNAGAVGASASEPPGLDGTRDEGIGPTWPTGVFACGMMRVTLRCARGECFS